MKNFLANKHYADLRVKIGAKRASKGGDEINKRKNVPFDQESVPSDIDDDQWAEIHNYDYQQYLLEQKKVKKQMQDKKDLVKETLDRQLKEQERDRMKTIQYNK